MLWAGQLDVPWAIRSAADWGEGGSWGHHHVIAGKWVVMQRATCCALVDCGEERNPCKYSTCVMGEGDVGKVMGHAISAQSCSVTGDNLAHVHRDSQTQPISASDAFAQRL